MVEVPEVCSIPFLVIGSVMGLHISITYGVLLMIIITVDPAVESTPKRKSWLLPLWQTFRQGKDIEH